MRASVMAMISGKDPKFWYQNQQTKGGAEPSAEVY